MPVPEPLADIAPAIEPTIVTSSPSRIHTVPRPMRIFQCHLDHGKRSNRAGMLVSIVRSSRAVVTVAAMVSSCISVPGLVHAYPRHSDEKRDRAPATPLLGGSALC